MNEPTVNLVATKTELRQMLKDAEIMHNDTHAREITYPNSLRLLKSVWRLAEQAGVEEEEEK